jgi:carboxylesterase type B
MRARKNNLLSRAPTAQTNYGAVRGRRLVLADGKEINVFLGIPYAKPPIGELRFKVLI